MNLPLPSIGQTLELAAWFFAWLNLILALYILVLNARHIANRHVGGFLLLLTINNLALSQLLGAEDVLQATVPSRIMAATSPAFGSGMFIVVIALLKPQWLRGRWRPVWWLFYGLVCLPALLTVADLGLGTRLWYTGLDASTYTGGYVALIEYTAGSLSRPVRMVSFYLMGFVTLIPLLYVALLDKKVSSLTRRLAWLLLTTYGALFVLQMGLQAVLTGVLRTIIATMVFAMGSAFAIFQQMVSERRLQRGSLRARLTVLTLVITVPLIIAVVRMVPIRVGQLMAEVNRERLSMANRLLKSNAETWLDLNVGALRQLASLPDIVSMDAEQQKPALEAMATAYPHLQLVSTIDLDGVELARSDDATAKDHSTRMWFQRAKDGESLTLQASIDRTRDEPVLIAAVPIKSESGEIVGVAMFSSYLIDIADKVRIGRTGETGLSYVVDADNRVLAHTDPAFTAQLRSFAAHAPVVALRQGTRGEMVGFVDEEGLRQQAYVDELDNGWGVVVQLPERELEEPQRLLQRLVTITSGAGIILLTILIALATRQAVRPIASLTETALAISAGDLTRTAPVESEDEIGTLARTFNSMTEQIREFVGGLEERVAERTAELERRAAQLQAVADLSHVTTSVIDLDELLHQAVDLVNERFGLYHTSLFLLDETGRWAEYRAGTGEVGRLIEAQRLRLEIGGASMIGWCTAYAQPRIAQDVNQEALYQAYTFLPDTRSEAVLPLIARGRVIGALDAQSSKIDAFSPGDVTLLRTVADQIAIAIDNVRLLTEVQESLAEAQAVHRHYLQEAWSAFTTARPSIIGYRFAAGEVKPDAEAWLPAMADMQDQSRPAIVSENDGATTLSVPITLHGETVGLLGLKKDDEGEWTDEEVAVAQTVVDQVALSLENQRLFDEARRLAQHETLVRELSEKIRRTNDRNTILETAVQVLGQTLGSARAFVRLTIDDGGGHE